MQIHRIVGASLSEALERARRAHGEDALVISQEMSVGGGVTLAVARRNQTAPASKPRDTAPEVPAGVRELLQRLRRHGASEEFSAGVRTAVESRRDSAQHALDAAAEHLGASFQSARGGKAVAGRARVLVFAGSTGVGKTTCAAKLLLRFAKAGRRVAAATFDVLRPGAAEGLRAWTDLLGAPLYELRGASDARASLCENRDVLLVDTTGKPAHNLELVGALRTALRRVADVETHLVLPATVTRGAARAAGNAFAPLEPRCAIVTKLDETREPAAVLEYVLDAKLPISFLCDGPDVGRHLRRPQPDHLADLFLRGRLA